MMPPPREIELKLEVPENSIAGLDRSSLLKRSDVVSHEPITAVSVYFDTKEMKLRSNGLSLRVRRIGRRHVQTIKQENGERAGLFVRKEWECDISARRPDLDVATGTAFEHLLNKKTRLRPVFLTRAKRKVYSIHKENSEIDLTVDRGTILSGLRSSAICEVELELKRGKVDELFTLARVLGEEIPIRLAFKSKADRGYALIGGEKAATVEKWLVALTPEFGQEVAFQAIARACLRQLVANEPAMQIGESEALHQMRVALRRMRVAISLFSDMLFDPKTKALKAEFKWLGGKLAPARELDVFIARALKPAAGPTPNRPRAAVPSKDLRKSYERAFSRAQSAVRSARFRGLVLDTAAWIETGEWTVNNKDHARTLRERPIAATATKKLRRYRREIIKRGAKLNKLDPQRRHKLRIRVKKLRYASEFLAGVFPGKGSFRRREKFVAALKRMQGTLGDLNDIVVHEELAEQIADARKTRSKQRRSRAKSQSVAGRVSGHRKARIAALLQDAQRAYRLFAKAQPFWL
jgi:triphosphatase